MILVTGGVRSGKSAFAEAYARRLAGAAGGSADAEVLYVATARVWDAETADRVARHRAGRPPAWRTLEAPLDPAGALAGALAERAAAGAVVVLDSVDFWVSNRLLEADPVAGEQVHQGRLATLEGALLGEVDAIARLDRSAGLRLLLVTLEAGQGVVPPSPLGRAFRDLLGRVNQALARQADEVYLLVAGLPVDVKRLSAETWRRLEGEFAGGDGDGGGV